MEFPGFTILRNERKGENDFSMDYPCDYCNSFVEQVISLENTCEDGYNHDCEILICKGCLSRLIEALDKNMQENFQLDFEASRIYVDIEAQRKEDIDSFNNERLKGLR